MRILKISLLALIILFSCSKPDEEMMSNAQLNFSSDTITFDTIFSSIGSITKTLTIYNNNNFDVISAIIVEKQDNEEVWCFCSKLQNEY